MILFEGIFHFQILAVAQVQRSQHLHSTRTGSKSSEFECLKGLGAGCMPAVEAPNMSASSAYFSLLHSTSPFPEMSINKPLFLIDEYWIRSFPWYMPFREHSHCKIGAIHSKDAVPQPEVRTLDMPMSTSPRRRHLC